MKNSVETADSSLLRQIRTLRPSLSSAMQRVADYVLQHPEGVIYLSVTEMAAECNVGEATVIRFCQQLNLSGYQDFKIKLSQSLVEPLKSLHTPRRARRLSQTSAGKSLPNDHRHFAGYAKRCRRGTACPRGVDSLQRRRA